VWYATKRKSAFSFYTTYITAVYCFITLYVYRPITLHMYSCLLFISLVIDGATFCLLTLLTDYAAWSM